MTFRRDIQWTSIVLQALIDAKQNPEKMITIQVAKPESANAVEQAILALMADGNTEAWRISVELHTLN